MKLQYMIVVYEKGGSVFDGIKKTVNSVLEAESAVRELTEKAREVIELRNKIKQVENS